MVSKYTCETLSVIRDAEVSQDGGGGSGLGIKAEGEAIFCGFKMVVLLSSVFFWVLPLYAGGGCIAGSFARLLLPFRLGVFASGCSTLST